MKQQKQVEKLLQLAQRKQNQLLGVQPNQELNALIITDESHKKAKEQAQLNRASSLKELKLQELQRSESQIQNLADANLDEENFDNDKNIEVMANMEQVPIQPLPSIDLKSMPTFKD